MITPNQLSMADIFSDCQEILDLDKPHFLDLLENHIDLDKIVPASLREHFYASTGRCRKYSLESMLWAWSLQRIFSIPANTMLLTFLLYAHHLRRFCGFDKVPDPSKITRFKQGFCDDFQLLFDRLIDLTEPICQQIDPHKAAISFFYSTGIEVFVKENNPKFFSTMIWGLKVYAKAKSLDNSFDPYKAAYSRMPSHTEADRSMSTEFLLCHQSRHFSKAFIPRGPRANPIQTDYSVNEAGIPCCPENPALPMKPEGNTSHLRCGIPTFKFVCPKMTWDKGEDGKYHRVCHCQKPCTFSRSRRMVYIYPERDLRMNPGMIRDTQKWNETYKIRGCVERMIHHFKDSCCLNGRRSRNPKTLRADLLLCGITQLITVLLADSIHRHQHIRSLKNFIA